MKRVLVTGNCGFIGHHLVRELKKRKYIVYGVDDLSGGDEQWKKLPDVFIQQDINDLERLSGVDIVFHTAAIPRIQTSIEEPMKTHHANVEGTVHLLEIARQSGVKRFVYSASSSAYGNQDTLPLVEDMKPNPLNPYALHKLIGEYYCDVYNKIYGLSTISLRYFNVYGPEQPPNHPYAPVIAKFKHQRNNKLPLTIFGDGEQKRDFTFVGDVVNANIAASSSKHNGIFNICAGQSFSVNQIADFIGGNKEYHPARLGEIRETLGNNEKSQQLLKWKPEVSLQDWLK